MNRNERFLVVSLTVFLSLTALVPGGTPVRGNAAESSVRGEVTAVYDGDTIKVRLESGGERRVRLIGIDAPEPADSRETVRFIAFTAKRYAYLNLYGRSVTLTFDREREDAYGRLLAFIRLEDGTLFNETLIREGFASAYLKFPFDSFLMETFRQAEREARTAGRGLWREEPYPGVAADRAGDWEGRIVTVAFRCGRAFDRGRFRILKAGSGEFETVVPRDVLAAFPGSLSFENRDLRVTGLVERYRGRPQIMVGVPGQVKVVD